MQLGGVVRLNPACRSTQQLPEETFRDPKRSFSPQRSAPSTAGAESSAQRWKGPTLVPALPTPPSLNQGSPFPTQGTPWPLSPCQTGKLHGPNATTLAP